MNVRELVATLQQIPDQEMPAYVIGEFSGIPGISPITEVKTVRDGTETESWYKQDNEPGKFPRVEIT